MWVYLQSEPNLYTVGFFNPSDEFTTESDWGTKEEAAERVNYLNGGTKTYNKVKTRYERGMWETDI